MRHVDAYICKEIETHLPELEQDPQNYKSRHPTSLNRFLSKLLTGSKVSSRTADWFRTESLPEVLCKC